MKEIVVTIPISYPATEDKWVKSHLSKKFDETSTVKDILDFVEKANADLGSAVITELK